MLLGNLIYWLCCIVYLVHGGYIHIVQTDGKRILFIGNLALFVALFMIGIRVFPLNDIH